MTEILRQGLMPENFTSFGFVLEYPIALWYNIPTSYGLNHFYRRVLFEKHQYLGDCIVNGRFANTFSAILSYVERQQFMKGSYNEQFDDTFGNRKRLQSSRRADS